MSFNENLKRDYHYDDSEEEQDWYECDSQPCPYRYNLPTYNPDFEPSRIPARDDQHDEKAVADTNRRHREAEEALEEKRRQEIEEELLRQREQEQEQLKLQQEEQRKRQREEEEKQQLGEELARKLTIVKEEDENPEKPNPGGPRVIRSRPRSQIQTPRTQPEQIPLPIEFTETKPTETEIPAEPETEPEVPPPAYSKEDT
ncbi:hypothetical protein DFP72DRAFT_1069072 [Ephemerocybe angulata]|uniref:Uncharacterized protein n=1 Tax=Ephemerocybe angulata TaxID=980116 RepID=A0A8H6HVB2_9AGAR|nr:hypothetical protein DFP72DRAFT_1069072 [Tulosesus angulatus]